MHTCPANKLNSFKPPPLNRPSPTRRNKQCLGESSRQIQPQPRPCGQKFDVRQRRDNSGRGCGRGGQAGTRKKRKRDKSQGDKGKGLDELSDTEDEELSDTEDEELSDAEDEVQSKTTKITARNPHFKDLVLGPRRIVCEESDTMIRGPYSHFGTTAPPRRFAWLHGHRRS
jgi:hypothetical protein